MINEKNVRRYCYEDIRNIENYEQAVADREHMWDCHHKVETLMNCGARELIAHSCYYHRPAHELVFLSKADHRRLHSLQSVGRRHTSEAKRKMSDAQRGKHISHATRSKISDALKGRPHPWLKGKPSPRKGKTHTVESRRKMSMSLSGEKHPNFGKHLSEDTRRRIGAANSKPHRLDIHENIETIRRLKASGWSQRRISKHFNCSESLISVLLHS